MRADESEKRDAIRRLTGFPSTLLDIVRQFDPPPPLAPVEVFGEPYLDATRTDAFFRRLMDLDIDQLPDARVLWCPLGLTPAFPALHLAARLLARDERTRVLTLAFRLEEGSAECLGEQPTGGFKLFRIPQDRFRFDWGKVDSWPGTAVEVHVNARVLLRNFLSDEADASIAVKQALPAGCSPCALQ